jgi:hypothetical protein
MAVNQIVVTHGDKVVEAVFNYVSIHHALIALFNLSNLILQLILENLVEVHGLLAYIFFLSIALDLFQTLVHEHL